MAPLMEGVVPVRESSFVMETEINNNSSYLLYDGRTPKSVRPPVSPWGNNNNSHMLIPPMIAVSRCPTREPSRTGFRAGSDVGQSEILITPNRPQ